jgi:hypothetical protein
MLKRILSTTSTAVKPEAEKRGSQLGTRLIPLLLQRKGVPAEIYYAPECLECGKPILDFREANVSVTGETDAELIPIGKLDDVDAFLIPSDGAFAVHKECDATGRGSWVSAHCVFRNDQRYAFERRRGL